MDDTDFSKVKVVEKQVNSLNKKVRYILAQ